MFKNILNSFRFSKITLPVRSLSANTSAITKIHRSIYARPYPTLVVLSDGSTINIRYHEPRKIIKMPLDLTQLTEQERKARIEKRKPKVKIVMEDDIEDNFNARKYLVNMKNKKK